MCINHQDVIRIISRQNNKKEIEELLCHVRSCEQCHKKVESYREAIGEFENLMNSCNPRGS